MIQLENPNIGSGDMPSRRQTIIWTNDGYFSIYVSLDLNELIGKPRPQLVPEYYAKCPLSYDQNGIVIWQQPWIGVWNKFPRYIVISLWKTCHFPEAWLATFDEQQRKNISKDKKIQKNHMMLESVMSPL